MRCQPWQGTPPTHAATLHTPVKISLQTRLLLHRATSLSPQDLRAPSPLFPVFSGLTPSARQRPTGQTPVLAGGEPEGPVPLVQDLPSLTSRCPNASSSQPSRLLLFPHLPPSPSPRPQRCPVTSHHPIRPSSQDLSASMGTDPDTRLSTQLTWTVLPRGFRDRPCAQPSPLSRPG